LADRFSLISKQKSAIRNWIKLLP